MVSVGDIVLVAKGQKTCFFEVILVEGDVIWIANGWVQITKKIEEIELICKAEERMDKMVPFNKFVNTK